MIKKNAIVFVVEYERGKGSHLAHKYAVYLRDCSCGSPLVRYIGYHRFEVHVESIYR